MTILAHIVFIVGPIILLYLAVWEFPRIHRGVYGRNKGKRMRPRFGFKWHYQTHRTFWLGLSLLALLLGLGSLLLIFGV